MKRAFYALIALVAICAIAGFAADTASAGTGGVNIVNDGYSPYFSPAVIHPGDTTVLTITTQQSRTEGPVAKVRISDLVQAGLTFVSAGDPSAVCATSTANGGQVTCTYTDYAHEYKSDSFTFASNPHQPYGSYAVQDKVTTYTSDGESLSEVGHDFASSTIRYAPKAAPPAHTNGGKLCYSVNGYHPDQLNIYTTSDQALYNALFDAGYWAPEAIGFNADGTPILACGMYETGGLLNDPKPASGVYTDNNGDMFTLGVDTITRGMYPYVPAAS